MNQAEYQEYLNSFWWKTVRATMLEQYPECQRCGFPYELNVHHKTYERLGKERIPQDLEVLCQSCHTRHHITDIEAVIDGQDIASVRARLEKSIKAASVKNSERAEEVKINQRQDQSFAGSRVSQQYRRDYRDR